MESKESKGMGVCHCGTYLGADQNGFCPECGGRRGDGEVTDEEKERIRLAFERGNQIATDRGIIEAAGKITKKISREPGGIIVPPPEGAVETVQDSLGKILEHRSKRFLRKHNK